MKPRMPKFDKMVRSGWIAVSKTGRLMPDYVREYAGETTPIVWACQERVPCKCTPQKVCVTIERDDSK